MEVIFNRTVESVSHVMLVICMMFTCSCAFTTTSAQWDDENVGATAVEEYRVQADWQRNAYPWPDSRSYWLKTTQNSQLLDMKRVFETWDFNGDGRVDMVQRFDGSGRIAETAYDFDLDGVVDWVVVEPN